MDDQEKNKICEPYLEKEILSPYTYLLKVRGKQLRGKTTSAFNYWLQAPKDKVKYIHDTVNMLYVGGLLIDDIQDNSKVRCGQPAAHLVYGVPLTINTSVHVLLLVLKEFHNFSPNATKIVTEQFLQVCRAQSISIYWRDNLMCPTEEEHKNNAAQLNGSMFMMIIQLMQLFSENKTDYTKLAFLLGYYFEVREDYCNLCQQKALEEWPAVEICKENTLYADITEGKYTLSIIHAMQTSQSEQILNILRKRTEDITLKKHCVALLERVGSLQYTRYKLDELDREARTEVSRLGGNPVMEAVLDELLSWKT